MRTGLSSTRRPTATLPARRANAETTVAGVLYLCADAATVKETVGNALAQGRAEKTGWELDYWEPRLRLARPWPAD